MTVFKAPSQVSVKMIEAGHDATPAAIRFIPDDVLCEIYLAMRAQEEREATTVHRFGQHSSDGYKCPCSTCFQFRLHNGLDE